MEDVFQQLQQKDDRIVQIFRNEEIEDLETFLELNERDYSRLQLTTKMIKTIEKLQAQFREKPEDCKEHEEWVEEVSNNDSENCQENAVSWDADNPYHGISLEEISYDFKMMKPAAGEFFEKWITLEQKILTTYKEMFKEIKHDFIRALAIIKEKNPSRGSKRRQADNGGNNPLNGIVHFIRADDEIPTDENIPLLIVRGSFSADSNECTLHLLGHNIPVGNDLRSAFKIYLESLTVFNITPAAFDKQFFLFFNGAVFGFETLSTTGMTFMHSLQQ
ncbi:uncharacterized protein LOC129719772 [Wyeomyia smithii]|uniref:uncharacterized protein LOC129719772 n=1 Tax=Wyeomyia smithii TaxID=174621 RepID=UPI0024680516|nr:uncharacterized protein LOC129719772 [Wyeomyia smithii]